VYVGSAVKESSGMIAPKIVPAGKPLRQRERTCHVGDVGLMSGCSRSETLDDL
jgi:hypothetical protein